MKKLSECIILHELVKLRNEDLEKLTGKRIIRNPLKSTEEISKLKASALNRYLAILQKDFDKLNEMYLHTLNNLIHSSKSDSLTGLFNQKTIKELTENEVSRSYWNLRNKGEIKNVSLLFLDLDDFKSFNSIYGHITGNKVLEIVAKCIKETIRTGDIPARFGGDEFVILLPETNENGALIVGKKLLQHFKLIGLGISIGINTCTPSKREDFDPHTITEELFLRANKAMHKVKVEGKNRILLA